MNWVKLMAVRVRHTWKGVQSARTERASVSRQPWEGRGRPAGASELLPFGEVPPWAEAAQPQDALPVPCPATR